jgi:hypothetical protein
VWDRIHLVKMHRIHRLLVIELGYEISDASANSKILCSSPPCYRRFVEEFVMGGENQSLSMSSLQGSGPLRWNPLRVRSLIHQVDNV